MEGETQVNKPPFYGWVMVALGALMTCVAVGAMFSLAVFLKPIQEATGWSRAGVSAAMTLNFLMMGLGGFLWGTLSDRYGPRPVVLAGSVLLGIGLATASRSTSLLEFQLAYGVLVDDLAEYRDRIVKAGGKIHVEEQEVPGMGWLSLFTDPEGRMNGLWKARPR